MVFSMMIIVLKFPPQNFQIATLRTEYYVGFMQLEEVAYANVYKFCFRQCCCVGDYGSFQLTRIQLHYIILRTSLFSLCTFDDCDERRFNTQ